MNNNICIVSSEVLSDIRIPVIDTLTTINKISLGTFIKINKQIYILTCNHGLSLYYKSINVIYYDKNKKNIIACDIVSNSHELDLALLIPLNKKINIQSSLNDDDFKNDFFYNNINFSTDMNVNKNDMTCDINSINMNNGDSLNIPCDITNIIFCKKHSFNIPEIPIVMLHIDEKYINEICGLSGSLVSNNKRILGILLEYDTIDNKLNILHSSMINRFIDEFKKTSRICGLVSIIGDFKIIQFKDNKNQISNGIFVNDTYDIKYNKNVYTKNTTTSAYLQKNDIILKINDLSFNNDGYILDMNYGIPMNLTSYISLKYKCDDIIDIEILRKKNNNEYKNKKIEIKARPIDTMKYVSLCNIKYMNTKELTKNNDYWYEFNGLTFMEIDEYTVSLYKKQNMNIKNIINKYINNKNTVFRDKNEKIVVLININDEAIDTANEYKYFFPFKKINENDDNYDICIIEKVYEGNTKNSKKISTLGELKNLLDQYSNNGDFVLQTQSDNMKFKIYFSNGKINQIKTLKNKI